MSRKRRALAWGIVVAACSIAACGGKAQVVAPRSARPHEPRVASSTPASSPRSRVRFEARVVRFVPNASWFHYADHTFAVFDVAEIEIDQPESARGRRVGIHHPPGTAADSPWRVSGQRLAFDADDDLLSGSVQTFVDGLGDVRFEPP